MSDDKHVTERRCCSARVSDFTPALLAEFLDRLRKARESLLDSMPIAIVLPPGQLVIVVLGGFPAR